MLGSKRAAGTAGGRAAAGRSLWWSLPTQNLCVGRVGSSRGGTSCAVQAAGQPAGPCAALPSTFRLPATPYIQVGEPVTVGCLLRFHGLPFLCLHNGGGRTATNKWL